ncbi:unnamed protein product [Protopolystoma xenopodis]|uniref:Uncharacterized protein n=1 Tax=Protopolystoma xenopodis TaxID=117903 RepID=A0A448XEC3_9PLAT|nr:unnamed protein product [Protopolystoma xenopodis]
MELYSPILKNRVQVIQPPIESTRAYTQMSNRAWIERHHRIYGQSSGFGCILELLLTHYVAVAQAASRLLTDLTDGQEAGGRSGSYEEETNQEDVSAVIGRTGLWDCCNAWARLIRCPAPSLRLDYSSDQAPHCGTGFVRPRGLQYPSPGICLNLPPLSQTPVHTLPSFLGRHSHQSVGPSIRRSVGRSVSASLPHLATRIDRARSSCFRGPQYSRASCTFCLWHRALDAASTMGSWDETCVGLITNYPELNCLLIASNDGQIYGTSNQADFLVPWRQLMQ